MQRIPLYLLDVVAFPGQSIPLHVHDEPHHLMVEECLATGTPIGVTRARPDQPTDRIEPDPELVGTAVRVLARNQLADGRQLLATLGQDRFRIVQVYHDRPYLEADIEWITESSGDRDGSEAARQALRREFRRLGMRGMLDDITDPVRCSYLVAAVMDASADDKQRLLEATTAADRMRLERRLLARSLPKIGACFN